MSSRFEESGPFVGLVPFSEVHADFFFGRERERKIVTANLKAARLTLLYGPSGVGKTSLLLAGVVPDLRRAVRRNIYEGRSAERAPLAVAVFRGWREDPLPALAEAIRSAAVEALAGESLDPWTPGESIVEKLRLWTARVRTILVVLDQVEDYFLYHGHEDGDGTFAVEFPRVVNEPGLRINFLLSIREDTLARLDRFKGRIPTLFGNYLRVELLDHEAGRAAIEKPIGQYTLLARDDRAPSAVEQELVEAVLSDVETGKVIVGPAGAGVVRDVQNGDGARARIEAPYLQLVLARLWSEEVAAGSKTLRLETLERLGGAEQIVRTHLDQALSSLPLADQEIAARLLHYLVTPSGTKIAHTAGDLAGYARVPETSVAAVLEALAGEIRILRPVGNSGYEIYHDVLAPAILDWRERFEARQHQQRRARRRRRRRWIFLAASSAAVAVAVVARSFNVLRPLELTTVDTRFAIRGSDPPPSDVFMVAIDDATFSDLKQQWPLPRWMHGRVIDRLQRAGARVIAYDVQFTEQTTAGNDNALINAVGRATGKVVLATTIVDSGGQTNVLGGDRILRTLGARAGNSTLPLDAGGVTRRLPYQTDGLQSFSVVAAEVSRHRRITRADLGGHNSTWIDFAGPAGSVRGLSFSRVLRGQFPRDLFRGKVVVVGPSAPSLQDVHATPFGSELMSGVEIQANAISTALRDFPLRSAPGFLSVGLIVVLGLVAPLASIRFSPARALVLAIAVGAAFVVSVQLAFNDGLILPVVYPLSLLVVTAVAALGLDAGS